MPAIRHWPDKRPRDPLDAAHASHLLTRADPERGAHPTRTLLFSLWRTAADAAGSREEARSEDVVTAPDGERQSGRGGQVRQCMTRAAEAFQVISDDMLRLDIQIHGHIHTLGRPNTALPRLSARPHTKLLGDTAARRLPPRSLHYTRFRLPFDLQTEQES